MTILFPLIYSAALTYLVWKAFKVMSNGWGISDNQNKGFTSSSFKQNKYTIHPELLDKSGNITQEELLTVRFSNDNDSTLEEKNSATD
ncbi:Conserved hypothetical protein [Prochlorococcus marinus str. MIT 9215]|uniref:DUF2973 domain-containing protein n=1 Tax=Prochlorococcus marinus (strain MIT 9215) TaxID=93060 RepID=A8G295_PROM2|nr:DUF2973 domain-containing protein [Prochlorococcus marinus]ABV49726.1 Conserved hypothetical protein [Prochlorococcus marinus str. MIT 9215]